jgi:hypothetical protein
MGETLEYLESLDNEESPTDYDSAAEEFFAENEEPKSGR